MGQYLSHEFYCKLVIGRDHNDPSKSPKWPTRSSFCASVFIDLCNIVCIQIINIYVNVHYKMKISHAKYIFTVFFNTLSLAFFFFLFFISFFGYLARYLTLISQKLNVPTMKLESVFLTLWVVFDFFSGMLMIGTVTPPMPSFWTSVLHF